MCVNRGKSFGSWLVPLMLVGLAACYCPKPDPLAPSDLTPDDQTRVSVAREQLSAAERKGTWDPQDDAKFSATIAALPPAARFELAKDLAGRLNSQKVRPLHPRPKPGRVVCPGLCDSGVKGATPVAPRPTGSADVKQDVKQGVK